MLGEKLNFECERFFLLLSKGKMHSLTLIKVMLAFSFKKLTKMTNSTKKHN